IKPQALSSKPGCAYGTSSPELPLGLTKRRDGSLIKSLPVGSIHGFSTTEDEAFVATASFAATLVFGCVAESDRPDRRGLTSYSKLCVFPGGSPLRTRQPPLIRRRSRGHVLVASPAKTPPPPTRRAAARSPKPNWPMG